MFGGCYLIYNELVKGYSFFIIVGNGGLNGEKIYIKFVIYGYFYLLNVDMFFFLNFFEKKFGINELFFVELKWNCFVLFKGGSYWFDYEKGWSKKK